MLHLLTIACSIQICHEEDTLNELRAQQQKQKDETLV